MGLELGQAPGVDRICGGQVRIGDGVDGMACVDDAGVSYDEPQQTHATALQKDLLSALLPAALCALCTLSVLMWAAGTSRL